MARFRLIKKSIISTRGIAVDVEAIDVSVPGEPPALEFIATSGGHTYSARKTFGSVDEVLIMTPENLQNEVDRFRNHIAELVANHRATIDGFSKIK